MRLGLPGLLILCAWLLPFSTGHWVVKVPVNQRPPRFNSIPQHTIHKCPRYIRSAKSLRYYPVCCLHPVIYNRYKNQCSFLKQYRRRKRDVSGVATLLDSGDEKIEVKCCGTGETHQCSGAKCFYVCDVPGSPPIVDTFDITSTDDLCNPDAFGANTSGRRKKRGTGYSAANSASWKINWCPRKVTNSQGKKIRSYKICCLHPCVSKHPWNSKGAEGGVANWCHGQSRIFPNWKELKKRKEKNGRKDCSNG